MNDDASQAKNNTKRATSSGAPKRPERDALAIALADAVGVGARERTTRDARARGSFAVDGPRRHRVDAHIRREFEGQRLRELDHCRLGRAVVRELGARAVAGARAEVDDGAGAAGACEVAAVCLRAQKRALDADIDRAVVELFGGVEKRRVRKQPGVVDQDVETPEALCRGLDHRRDRGRVAHVGDEGLGLAAGLADERLRRSRALDIDVGDHHARARFDKPQCDCAADARARAGHDGSPPGERPQRREIGEAGWRSHDSSPRRCSRPTIDSASQTRSLGVRHLYMGVERQQKRQWEGLKGQAGMKVWRATPRPPSTQITCPLT